MTNVKNMAAFVAAFVCVMMNFVLTSCQQDGEFVQKELAAPKTEYKTVTVQNYINSFSWFVNNNVYVNGVLGMTYNIDNEKTIIEMPVAQQGMPSLSGNAGSKWNWSDSQVTTTSVETYNTDELNIWGDISPLYNKSTSTRLHAKVLKIDLVWLVDGGFKLADRPEVNFSREETRTHYQVDPSVRVDTVKQTETQIEYVFKEVHDTTVVEKHDTTYVEIINNVETIVHDTVTVEVIKEVEKEILKETFIQGAEVNTSISNNWGSSTATMDLGSTHLLTLNIKHSYNPITVAEYGASLTSGATAIEWFFNDSQHTTSNSSANNAKVESITWLRNETENIEGVGCLITTVFRVDGYYTNENGDKKNFSFEMKPMYLQTKEAAPQPTVEPKAQYRGIIRKVTAEGLKLMTKPIVQKWNGSAWEDVRTCSRSCIGMSGSPSGLDLYVKSTKVVEENEDSWWYKATGNDVDKTWIGDDTKSDGTIVTKETKVYQFNHLFTADAVAEGKVGPATQLYLMRATKVQVLDPENNLLTCTWEDGTEFSLSLNAKINDTEFVEKAEMKGQTKVMSDKTYEYAISFVQHFSSSIGGYELQNVDATSTLWIAK